MAMAGREKKTNERRRLETVSDCSQRNLPRHRGETIGRERAKELCQKHRISMRQRFVPRRGKSSRRKEKGEKRAIAASSLNDWQEKIKVRRTVLRPASDILGTPENSPTLLAFIFNNTDPRANFEYFHVSARVFFRY